MNKEMILAIGSSSWWKHRKVRKESASTLRKIKKEWKFLKKELQIPHTDSIDTKIYKKYYFYK